MKTSVGKEVINVMPEEAIAVSETPKSVQKIELKESVTIFKPRIICIEFPGEGIDHRTLWEHYFTPFYDFKEVLVNNAFYLRKENI